jgi:hypothetical protein
MSHHLHGVEHLDRDDRFESPGHTLDPPLGDRHQAGVPRLSQHRLERLHGEGASLPYIRPFKVKAPIKP